MKPSIPANSACEYGSPPARGRGLKRVSRVHALAMFGSPPARGRGLKQLVEIVERAGWEGRPPRGGVD